MLVNTEGIVLNSIKYGESSQISKVYTKKHGLVSIISSSGKKTKYKSRIYFQALAAIKLVFYYKNSSSLHRLKEVSFADKENGLYNEMDITAIKFFLAELLSILIKEEEENEFLYNFLAKKVAHLNSGTSNTGNFHIDFLMDFSSFMGIQPNFNDSGSYFDLEEGQMVSQKPIYNSYLNTMECITIKEYLANQKQTKQEKKIVLNALINYYQVQIGGLHQLKSRQILEIVFA